MKWNKEWKIFFYNGKGNVCYTRLYGGSEEHLHTFAQTHLKRYGAKTYSYCKKRGGVKSTL